VLRQLGFSLIELIVVIVVLGIVASMGAVVVRNGLLGYLRGREVTSTDWQARLALERITRELRDISPSFGGVNNIAAGACDSSTFTFTTIYPTVYATPAIGYTLNANTLMRNGVPLASNVTGLIFHCLQNDGQTSTVTPTQVYYVTVSMTIATTNTSANVSYRSTVKPRNF
jgi:prepilin-type N-terminal cleavage/methylation domain-containing protein